MKLTRRQLRKIVEATLLTENNNPSPDEIHDILRSINFQGMTVITKDENNRRGLFVTNYHHQSDTYKIYKPKRPYLPEIESRINEVYPGAAKFIQQPEKSTMKPTGVYDVRHNYSTPQSAADVQIFGDYDWKGNLFVAQRTIENFPTLFISLASN